MEVEMEVEMVRSPRSPWLLTVILAVAGIACSPRPSAKDAAQSTAQGAEAAQPVTVEPIRLLPAAERGEFHRPIITRVPEAQQFFDQGLVFTYGFDHAEAIRSFARAAELDPSCAMAYWGMAFAAGPHINNPFMDDEANRSAHEASKKAMALRSEASEVEVALIEAVARRYAWPPPEDRRSLDLAFAEAMRDAYRQFPEDPDVGALCAEAMMDLRPWDLWTGDGQPRPETPEIVGILERTLELYPDHPQANHLYIHAIEASPHPEKGIAAADRLRARIPAAGHLVHMPAHIDIRLGRYADAIAANERGIAIDRGRVERAGAGGFYAVYRAHNYHFLVYAAMFDGQSRAAGAAARQLLDVMPLEVVRGLPDFLDGFLATPYHVRVRFGQWSEMLAEPEPPADLPVTHAFWRYGRGIALCALARVEEATREREAFLAELERVPETSYIGNNPSSVVLTVARTMLDGEWEFRRGNFDAAFAHLERAVVMDDSLRYDEPWGWFQPVRHALGALLLEQGRVAEAEAVYREDLRRHPENGWSLQGLAECLERRGETAEAARVTARFNEVWARADVKIKASCFCRRV